MTQPLRAIYERLGARFVEIGGGRLPDTVSGLEAEYEAAMATAVVFERFRQGQVAVAGADRESFLHNMLTNDVKNLAVGSGLRAAFLTNKGKLISDLLLSKEEGGILLRMEASRVEPLRMALDRYIISEDVALSNLDEMELSFSVAGPEAARVVSALVELERDAIEGLPHLGIAKGQWAGAPVRIIAFRHELTPRFDLLAPSEGAIELFTTIAEARDVALAGYALSETRRVEAGFARFGVDMDETNLPLEAGLEEAVSFDKGCYIGQEYVVRLAHRGHLNRKLVGLRVSGSRVPPAGTAIHGGGAEAGYVTSAVHSPHFDSVLALGYLKRPYFEPGTEVEVEGVGALTSSLPFGGE